MNSLSLRQLRYVEALARHGHFGRAAEDCAISQPALSMQVRALEEALGAPLFERGGRTVRPTPLGEAFVERARAILRAVDDLGDLARAAGGRLAGRVRLGVIPTVAPYLLPRILAALPAEAPGLDLQVRETVTPRLVRDLGEGRLDAALVALPLSEPALAEVALFSETFVLIRPEGEAGRPVPSAEALATMRLLLLEEGHCFRDQALAVCGGAGRPREVLEGSALTTLVQMVQAGIGVTLIPEMAVAVETRAARVAVDRFPPPAPARTIGMVWRRTSPLAPALARLAGVVRAVHAETPPRA
jgi:LysR family hydrogen peroxide-inducible transcriptional activator